MTALSSSVVLAIAPRTRHLGYALLEGGDLIRFGVKTLSGKKTPRTLWLKVQSF